MNGNISGSETGIIVYKDRILETIDLLRQRKARPDINRICSVLAKKFNVDPQTARNDLQLCVERKFVNRVEYKGNISYRNAEKKKLFQRPPQAGGDGRAATVASGPRQQATNGTLPGTNAPLRTYRSNKRFVGLLDHAISELILQEPDYLMLGVPSGELVKKIVTRNPKFPKKYVYTYIDKQVEEGALMRLENGNYQLPPRNSQPPAKTAAKITAVIPPAAPVTPTPVATAAIAAAAAPDITSDSSAATSSSPSSPAVATSPDTFDVWQKQAKMYRNSDIKKSAATNDALRDSDPGGENSVRVGSRRKRARKVFDPSDNLLPKKRGRPSGSFKMLERQLTASESKENGDAVPPESSNSNPGACFREQFGGVCSVCHNDKKDLSSREVEMVACRDCSNKAHLGCLTQEDNKVLKMYSDSAWQCSLCRTCTICIETSISGSLKVCSMCADAYHLGCHDPPISESIQQDLKWMCRNCQMPDPDQLKLQVTGIDPTGKGAIVRHDLMDDDDSSVENSSLKVNSPDVKVESFLTDVAEVCSPRAPPAIDDDCASNRSSLSQSPTPPRLSPQNIVEHNGHRIVSNYTIPDLKMHDMEDFSDSLTGRIKPIEEFIDPSIPDVSNWSIVEVYNYFCQYFTDEVASVFKAKRIDGGALLLMEKFDIIKSLDLTLGTALKICKHVMKLQFRNDVDKLYWT